ncbi:hypothetical protein [Candidatus Parabeggiatoa sp. HSG14]|uniref:hypothetical protein n=1 Tax=Candidatus Parabeggiatoa sp. HSG14 TaxID=3055593 RepID=UPI0025A85E48|nr:hypothetical protein [Thiotrichales bacterium HSG14]
MRKKLLKLSVFLLLIGIIPLNTQAGITMSNMLEFIFDKSEVGELEQAELSLSEDSSAWGLKFKQADKQADKNGQEIWRVGIYFEGNFRLLKNEFIIPKNIKHKDTCLQGPIFSPQGKRWGLVYKERTKGEDCNKKKKDSCRVIINLETFGPFNDCGQLQFSATDNFSFFAQKNEKQQIYSRVVRNILTKENGELKPHNNFDTSKQAEIAFSPGGNHWLLSACIEKKDCYVQEKGNQLAKGPYKIMVSKLYHWGNWEKPNADNRAWAITYFNNKRQQKVFVNTEKESPLTDVMKVLQFAHSQHQAKAWGLIYRNLKGKETLFIKDCPTNQIPTHSKIRALTFAPRGASLAFSYQKPSQKNWQTGIYSLKDNQLEKHFTAEACREVDCDFKSVEQLTISDYPKRFWGYVGVDGNQQYLVIYENRSHWRTLGPFAKIKEFHITPDGHSWGMRYASSHENEIGYYIYDRYAGLSKHENISWGSNLHFSSDSNKLFWGFVYKGRKSHNEIPSQYYVIINGTKITSRKNKQRGFVHAHIAQLKKSGENTKVFSLVYLDKVAEHNKQTYRVRVNKIEQPYITVSLSKQPWATSHTPNVGYQKILQIGDQNFCKGSNEQEIERVCIEKPNSSKIAALRLFFKRLGLERGKTKLEIHQCESNNDKLQCRKPIISASKLIEFLKDKEGITNYSVNKTNFWLDIPMRGLPIQMRYEVTGDSELLGHSRLEYPFGYKITQIEYMLVDQKLTK